MATEPPAAALGVIRRRLEYLAGNGDGDRVRVTPADLRALVAAYDAQAARLAAVGQVVSLWTQGAEGSLETLEALEALLDGTEPS